MLRLQSLDLSCNMLSDEGLNAIFVSQGVEPPDGIVAPSLISLTALNLSENNLTELCAKHFGAFLERARSSESGNHRFSAAQAFPRPS